MKLDQAPLQDALPGIENLLGTPSEDLLGGPLHRFLEGHNRLSWAAIASMTEQEIALVRNVGPIRTKKVLSNIASLIAQEGVEVGGNTLSTQSMQSKTVSGAIQEIASWAVATGQTGSVFEALLAALAPASADLSIPSGALSSLRSTSVLELSDPEQVALYDPELVAKRVLESFDDRERIILDRVLSFDKRQVSTLEVLGVDLGITRQRVQQIEVIVKEKLGAELARPEAQALVAAADRLRARLGAAAPAELLSQLFDQYPPDQIDQLILYMAGPYQFDGDWYVFSELAKFDTCVLDAFDSAQEGGVASRDAVSDALAEIGVRSEYVEQALNNPKLLIMDGQVLDWTGSMEERAERVLQMTGRAMLMDELAEIIEPGNFKSMSQQVQDYPRISRVGKARYALASWDLGEYQGIVPAMLERLAEGPMTINVLGAELAEEFGISPHSVVIHSTTNPAFLKDGDRVMLRPEDQPYVPSATLESTAHCYVVGGVWAMRVQVDRDVLRGSGRQIPEAMGVHLGVEPLGRGSVDSPVGTINLHWGQYPAIGSLRALAGSVDADEGDWLFIRRVTPSSIDVSLLRSSELPTDPAAKICALVGSAGSTHDIERVLADALGLKGTINHDLTEERDVLVARREHDLVDLLAEL
jgi:hypothetical protein